MEKLFHTFDQITYSKDQDTVQENANTDGQSPPGIMGLFASEASKLYAMKKLLHPDVLRAYEDGYIHVHDLDYYATGTTTCCQLPLGKVLATGFTVGTCYMRPPSDISSAMAQASILIQSNQNNQHGGQSYPMFDYDLAPYVEKTYVKQLELIQSINPSLDFKDVEELAMSRTEEVTYQASEAFIHNANSMLCRNGMQVPFVSINYGTDTSVWGRMVMRNMLKATQAGLGDGSTPIFPIQVFKVKEGINFNEGDPNYDIYRMSLETTSKRLFPNYVFIDATFNLQYYEEGNPRSEIATMGCRTRVFGNVNGEDTPVARGNLSFTSINLPMLAKESDGNIDLFFNLLTDYTKLCIKQLEDRYYYQRSRKAGGFKILYSQGVWKNGETLGEEDEIGDVLKTGTLSVGFIGLAEALILLTGSHHGESETSWTLGYDIVKNLRSLMDEASVEKGLNYSLLATPAESYCQKALKKFVKTYGVIDRVSDKNFFTNSNHIPVWYPITATEKIRKEAPFHELTNAGHITYVELDGAASKNVEALDTIIRTMRIHNVGYGSINHPVDRCKDCSYVAVIDDQCPKCNSSKISRIRRITGYLVGDIDKWNTGKQAEEKERLKHGISLPYK